ncbi:putative 3',5'-cyclic phosphodiesterase pde-5 [Armadillidium nasatum]|uniref:3',5'-cyclic-GMP phosphodiesterase n=1 Tax=Armadillidium nasatum TaxID=96803 RepID=A0A5N5TBG3_9CRUS|nr:putative 3',5'-cyclic phosphodiesterase pde-5 [Armadillidium nasatum]
MSLIYLTDDIEKELEPSFGAGGEPEGHNNASDNSSESGVDLRKITRKTSLSRWKFCVHADKRKMLEDMTETLQTKPNKSHILWELSQCIVSAINADGANLYLANHSKNGLELYNGEPGSLKETDPIDVEEGTYVSSFVASTKRTIRVSGDVTDDSRFPQGYPFPNEDQHHILAMPVSQSNGKLAGVLELYRKESSEEFHEEDEEIVNSYLVWGGIALHYSELYHSMMKQRELNDFLLSVVQFPLGTGVAGIVAQTGTGLNIEDAYSDSRFNRNVDQITKYVTKSILCMPILIRKSVIGVVQMINKTTGKFTKEDEESFETFAIYCGLALHHAKLYDKIRRSEQKYKVALEIMSYHANCAEDDFSVISSEEIPQTIPEVDLFYFSPLNLDELDKVRHTIYMFVDLFGLARFDKDCLIRFCLTVRKNYRRVPYHNWTHGFSVANSMYAIIKHDPKVFRPLECLSLFIGAPLSMTWTIVARTTNFFWIPTVLLRQYTPPQPSNIITSTRRSLFYNRKNHGSPLLSLGDPAGSQHIVHLPKNILFSKLVGFNEGHNIFIKLTSSEYKQVLGNIKHCILATDLAVFFPNKSKLTTLVEDGTFSWDDQEHRLMLEAVTMTASDLCASAKPWDIQAETVKVIFEEFYDQGDAEKSAGRIPIPMMDRNKPEEQPSSQVGFLSGICIPCYGLIAKLIPSSLPLLDGCKKNLERWKELAEMEDEKKKQKEKEEFEKNVDKEANEEILQNNSSNEETSDTGGATCSKNPSGPKLGFKKAPDIREQRKVKRDPKLRQKDETTKSRTSTSKCSTKKCETQQHSIRRKDASIDK